MADLKVLFSSIANSLTANGKIDAQEAKMANDLGLAFVIAGMSEDDFTKAAQENQAQVSESDADIQQLMENISKKAAQVKAQNTAETTSTPSSEEPNCLTPPEEKELKPDREEWLTDEYTNENGDVVHVKVKKVYADNKLKEEFLYEDYPSKRKSKNYDGVVDRVVRHVFDDKERVIESHYDCGADNEEDWYTITEYTENGYVETKYVYNTYGDVVKDEIVEVQTDENGKPKIEVVKNPDGKILGTRLVDEKE